MKKWTVSVIHFKQSGKFYTEEKYVTEKQMMYDIVDEVKEKIKNKELLDFPYCYVNIVENDNPYSFPTLVIN